MPLHAAAAKSRVVLLVPTCNPVSSWSDFLTALQNQQTPPSQVIVLDSESTDGSAQAALSLGHTVHTVQRSQFNHGGTRQAGLDQYAQSADFAVFLTQDAILAHPEALAQLLTAFDDPSVAAAYGRQLPHANANAIAAHAVPGDLSSLNVFRVPAFRVQLNLDRASFRLVDGGGNLAHEGPRGLCVVFERLGVL
jgi:rhamnosyltransferase